MIMILFEKGTVKDLVLSLEKISLESPIYVFEFVNDITNEIVIFEALNESLYIERYSEFEINVNNYFLNATEGFWTYQVFEFQEEPEIKKQLEIGKMKLVGEAFVFTEYNGQSEDFITYK
jgi:hypothetical protein